MFPCTMHLYGIHQRVQFVMMPSSLHHALMMQLEMRFNGPQHRSRLCWAQNLEEFQGCITLIDGMLIKIHKSWNDGAHKVWFNG